MLKYAGAMQKPQWRATPLLRISIALHVGIVFALFFWPQRWLPALAILMLNHALLAASGLWPKSSLLGTNIVRLPGHRAELALTIDDGPDPEITPLVLSVLAQKNIKATFFCIAEKVAQHPELVKKMTLAGHRIENHSMRHKHYFSLMGWLGIKKELLAAQQTIARISGRTPQFFRAPAGLRNPLLDPLLHQQDLQLVSWTRRGFDTCVGDARRVLDRLLNNLEAGDILLLHDGHAARDKNGRAVILDVLPVLIDEAEQRGLHFVTLEEGLRT